MRVHSDGQKNLVCDIPNYHKSLLKTSANVASILLSLCKLISLYIDVHFLLILVFFLETLFKLIYLNEAIKHCGRANLGAACTQAHHICYFMILEGEEQFQMLRCLANCQFVFVNFKSVSDTMRMPQHHIS